MGDIFDGWSVVGRSGFESAGQHSVTEGTADGYFCGARGGGFCGAILVDSGAEFFLHEHACTACAAAETLITVAGHLF